MSVLLNPRETWAAVKQHMSPLTAFQMNCLRRTCGIPLRDHVPYVVIPDSCNTLSVESPLQGKRLGWQVMCSECLMIDCLRSLCSVKSRGFAHLTLGVFNDVSLHDCQNCCTSRHYRDAQDRLLWRDKTCPAHT